MEMHSIAVILVVALICYGTNVGPTTGRVAPLRQVSPDVTVGRVNTARLLDMCGNHG
jgi:hypothetical protein